MNLLLSNLFVLITQYSMVPAFSQLKFESPVFIVPAPHDDSSLYIVEQHGVIQKFENALGVTKSEKILDLSSVVLSPRSGGGSEEGLLGFAFDPEFKKTNEVFVYYSIGNFRRSRVSRFKILPSGQISKESEKIIIEIPQPYSNHNGGMLAFGPDGFLYIGLGDGGSANDPHDNAQNIATLLGKILRIDIRIDPQPYKIPPSNPFANQKNARPEIYAFGLRNPWRFSFDKKTKELWVGDVGQNLYEEIDIVEKGDNLGWRVFEGFHNFRKSALTHTQFKKPIHEYDHGPQGGISVTGGYVYRGNEFKDLVGAYIYGDFGSGRVWALKKKGNKVISNIQIATVPQLSSLGEDNAGNLYFLSYGEGKIYKLTR